MSNERENRIDLTQVEEMIEGPWSANWYPAEEGVEPDFLIQGGAEGHNVAHVSTAAGIILAYVPNGEEALAGQIAKLPDLIAELKKTYKEIDDLRTGLDMAHRCLAAHNFRQCHECGDHYHDDYGPLCGHTASQ